MYRDLVNQTILTPLRPEAGSPRLRYNRSRDRLVIMATTYILRSDKDGSYYVGSARDLTSRMMRHNKGLVNSTRNRRPLALVYSEEYATYAEAFRREKQIKNWKKRRAIENLIKRIGPAPANGRESSTPI